MKKLAWKQILVTFAISFVIGAFAGRWEFSHCMRRDWKDPEKRQEWILKRLDSRLRLNADQKQKISVILKETVPQMEAMRAEVRPRFEAMREQVRARIRPLLNESQQKKYEQMEQEWKERKESKERYRLS